MKRSVAAMHDGRDRKRTAKPKCAGAIAPGRALIKPFDRTVSRKAKRVATGDVAG
jgi:hypothetical protein